MNKRDFIAVTATLGAAAFPVAAAAKLELGPGLLTITGAIGKSNRGAIDPALDQMMVKHGVRFDKAFVFDSATLHKLPAINIRPTLEYDGKVHTLSGPLIADVLQAVGLAPDSTALLSLRAVDGYTVPLSLKEARAYRMIIATHIDGQPLALGGLGPQWAVYEADTLDAFRTKPLKDRFAFCPWGLYHINVMAT
jgi:hypothetical protein